MKNFNDIVVFINKALEGYVICPRDYVDGKLIIVYNNDKSIEITLTNDKIIEVNTSKHGFFTIENLTDKNIILFNYLFEECVDYCKQVGVEVFDNFFKEDDTPIDINDLDDKED